jgi:hypothetical protein
MAMSTCVNCDGMCHGQQIAIFDAVHLANSSILASVTYWLKTPGD